MITPFDFDMMKLANEQFFTTKRPFQEPLWVNLAVELEQMEAKELAYLQMVAPTWMLEGDPLLAQIDNLATLYREGRVVWAAIVQANTILFSHAEPFSCPAEVVYDPQGQADLASLTEAASRLYELKHTSPADPELQAYAQHITDELDRQAHAVPHTIASGSLMTAPVFVWRPHLPDGMLSMNILPILVHDKLPNVVTILPARFWQQSELYRQWCEIGGSEINPSAALYELNKDGKFWQRRGHHIQPTLEQLPSFASRPVAYQTYPTNAQSLKFIQRCREAIQLDYQSAKRTILPANVVNYRYTAGFLLVILVLMIIGSLGS